MDFNRKLKIARNKAQLTQRELCQLLDIPARTLETWEAGARVPPPHVQRVMLYALDVTRAQILAGELRADLVWGFVKPDTILYVLRDERGYICDWQLPPEDGEELTVPNKELYFKASAENIMTELEKALPLFSNDELQFIYDELD